MSTCRTYFNKRLEGNFFDVHFYEAADYIITTYDATLGQSLSLPINKRSYKISAKSADFSVGGGNTVLFADVATFLIESTNVGLQVSGTEPNYITEIYTDSDISSVDVEYTSGEWMTIYYVAANARTDKPFLIESHPGSSDRNNFTCVKYCKAAVRRGYVAATIDFDEVGGDWDNTRQKVSAIYFNAAVRKMKSLFATYGIDITRGVSMGQSRGGVNSWQGGIAWDDMTNTYFQSASNYSVNGENTGYTNALVASASAPGSAGGHYIDDFLSAVDHPHRDWHGDEDDTLPIEWSQDAVAAMVGYGIPSVLTTLVGEQHGIDADIVIPDLFPWFAGFL